MKILPLRKRLDVDRIVVQALLPHDFALQIAFGDAVGLIFGDKYVIVGQHDGIGRPAQTVDRPAPFAGAIDLVDAPHLHIADDRVAEHGMRRQAGQIDTAGIDLPPGHPGIATFFLVGLFRAQRHFRGRVAGQLEQDGFDLADVLAGQNREQIDQNRHAVLVVGQGQGQGDVHSHDGRVIFEGGMHGGAALAAAAVNECFGDGGPHIRFEIA